MRYLSYFIFIFGCIACEKASDPTKSYSASDIYNTGVHCEDIACADLIYAKNGQVFLWAGEDTSTHFNISTWSLIADNLRGHGLTRESLPALISPSYLSVSSLANKYSDAEPVIIVEGQNTTRVYPYALMKYHEVINDEIDGEAYMVCYCLLADFAKVYKRKVCGIDVHFGASGYTYRHQDFLDGNDYTQAFILWDRETESLWFPIIDQGISHSLNGIEMKTFNTNKWELSTWGEVKSSNPSAEVLQSGQDLDLPPITSYTCSDLNCCK